MSEQNLNRLTETERNWWLPEGWGFGGLGERAKGTKKHKWVVTG